MKSTLLSIAGLALGASATPFADRCKAVTFTVNGSAQNKNLTGIPLTTLQGLTDFFQAAPVVTVTGPQTLAGTYCAPTVFNSNNDKLEVFFGSIFSDRSGWQAMGGVGTDFPPYKEPEYSWVDFANAKGFATLTMDRLGNGKSSHPDPVIVVQAPYELALYNNLAQQIRSGKTGALPRAYNYLIYVGNSYGSELGAAMPGANPGAYNDFVLTGFTDNFQQDFAGVSLAGPAPAAVVDPARFGTLDPGYLTTSSEVGRTNSFFGSKAQVDYEDEVAHLFFVRKDVVSIGQLASVYGLRYASPQYTGSLFVLTGEQDQAACGPGSPVIGPAGCAKEGQLAASKELFPMAQYNYKTVDKTGHAIQLHLSSLKVYDLAHRYLAGEKFAGGPPA